MGTTAVTAESERPAANARQVEALAAVVDDVLADVANGHVGDVLDAHVADDGLHVRLEAIEHADDPDRRAMTVAEVTVDDEGTIVDVTREDRQG